MRRWLWLTGVCLFAQDTTIQRLSPAIVREGELVKLKVHHHPRHEQRFGMPLPPERYHFAGFAIDPPLANCGAVEKPCFQADPLTAERFASVNTFTFHGQPVGVEMNSWSPVLRPGHYEIGVVLRKTVLKGTTYHDTEERIVSNRVPLEVVPADEDWIRATVEHGTVDQVAAIDHPVARAKAVELFGARRTRTALRGVLRDLQRTEACRLLRERAQMPEQPLHYDYAYVTGYICERRDVENEIMSLIAGRGGDLDVLRFGMQALADKRPLPEYVNESLKAVIERLPRMLPARAQESLSSYWPLLRREKPIKELQVIAASTSPEWIVARRTAIQRLHELDPARARPALLKHVRTFSPTIDATLLDLIPSLENMDKQILAALRDGNHEAALVAARFLSPAAESDAKAIFNARTDCDPPLLAYLLRVDAAWVEKWLQQRPVDRCTLFYMTDTPRHYIHPVFEKYLIAQLQNPIVDVKWTAARSLMFYGTKAAKQPLIDALQYFHDYWKDRRAELENPSYQEGRLLEQQLRIAVSEGRAWLTTASELRNLSRLCITNRCTSDFLSSASTWEPLSITFSEGPHGPTATVAQYHGLIGMDALERKLSQFPKGTRFHLRVASGLEDEARIEAIVRRHGLAIQK